METIARPPPHPEEKIFIVLLSGMALHDPAKYRLNYNTRPIN
jgi:hypothetical protein